MFVIICCDAVKRQRFSRYEKAQIEFFNKFYCSDVCQIIVS